MTTPSIEELAAATPDTRDRSVDFLRAAAILAVVFGHWFIGIIHWDGGVIRTTSAVGVTSYLWLMTWVFQVMPILFFVGGFSNYVAYKATALAARAPAPSSARGWDGCCGPRWCSWGSGRSCRSCCTSPTPGRRPGRVCGATRCSCAA